jgi:hypothetical protein
MGICASKKNVTTIEVTGTPIEDIDEKTCIEEDKCLYNVNNENRWRYLDTFVFHNVPSHEGSILRAHTGSIRHCTKHISIKGNKYSTWKSVSIQISADIFNKLHDDIKSLDRSSSKFSTFFYLDITTEYDLKDAIGSIAIQVPEIKELHSIIKKTVFSMSN